MLLIRRPAEATRQAALDRASESRLDDAPRGRASISEETIGWGLKRYERARNALSRFEQFNLRTTSITPKTVARVDLRLAVLARRLGLWTIAPMQVVALTEDERSLSYTIRTVDGHPLRGEETFTVTRDLNGIVRFRIEATSKPRAPWAILIWPLIRYFQATFRRKATEHLRNATGVARTSVIR